MHDLNKCFVIITFDLEIDQTHQILNDLNWLGKFLEDISAVDKQSDMFRYPFNHEMHVFFEEQTHVNLHLVKQNFNTAYCILCDIWAEDFSNNKNYELQSPKLIITGGDYYKQSVVGYKFSKNDFYPFIKGYENRRIF